MLNLFLSLSQSISSLLDQFIEDKDLRLRLQSELQSLLLQQQNQLLKAKENIIVAEAKSESWLTRSWRPITMLTLVSIMVADWLGFTAPHIPPEIRLKLLDIIHFGLGGYIVGRSLEKTLPSLTEVLKRKSGG